MKQNSIKHLLLTTIPAGSAKRHANCICLISYSPSGFGHPNRLIRTSTVNYPKEGPKQNIYQFNDIVFEDRREVSTGAQAESERARNDSKMRVCGHTNLQNNASLEPSRIVD